NDSVPGLNVTAFAEWDCERRRRGGKSKTDWTPAAVHKAAVLLAKHTPEEQQAMVDMAMANGWQGLRFVSTAVTGPKKFDAGEYILDKVRAQYDDRQKQN
ncbi:MAG: hypothetical protein ACREX4_20160, partial [Gammaproteobacteria bacterium]